MSSLRQQGSLLIGALILLLIIGMAAAEVATIATTASRSSSSSYTETEANELSYAGLEAGLSALYHHQSRCQNLSTNVGTLTINNEQVSVSGTRYYVITQLGSTINNAVTTIPVVNSSSFADTGSIMIDREWINYRNSAGNQFTESARGAGGTTAVSHLSGVPVAQNQCRIQAVTTLSMPGDDVKATATVDVYHLPLTLMVGNNGNFRQWDGVQITSLSSNSVPSQSLRDISLWSYAEAWAVGDADSGFINIAHWNGTAWTRATTGNGLLATSAANENEDLNAISCVFNDGCWAVGDNAIFVFYNRGSDWQYDDQLINGSGQDKIRDQNYYGVSCTSPNFCLAVGSAQSQGPPNNRTASIAEWDGNIWERFPKNNMNNIENEDMNAVSCTASTNCWLVGNATNGNPQLNINHLSGNTISRDTTVPNIQSNLNDVYCTTASDCWAVGNQRSGALILHYDGNAWVRFDEGNLPAVDLNGVYCNAADDCWVVSDSGAGHYDGNSWGVATTPDNTRLTGVMGIPISQRPHDYELQ